MTPERHQQIGEIYHDALELEADDRAAFLDRACVGDDALRREVESLIASHEQASDFIAKPALAVAAGLLAGRESLVGQTLAHYRVLSLIGEGGMGEVYLAEDTRLGRRVALKLLSAAFTNDEERMRRFMQEARAASALNHPNILTVHEIGQADGVDFIATEFIEGETLRPSMAKRQLRLTQALDIAAQVAGALAAAHAAGVVHRDIKPENIMLRPDGYVKVLDFGLAKLAGPGLKLGNEISPVTQVKTNPGVVMGTMQYMSPEQARGLAVDARTDVWSLGVVLYEMVAGRPPFARETHSDTIVSILEREPAPLVLHAPEVSAELERIVTKALSKDKDERYQTVKDMAIDLRRLRRRLDVDAEIERSGQAAQSASGSGETVAISSGAQRSEPTQTEIQSAARASYADESRRTSSVEYVVEEIKRHRRGAAMLGAALVLLLGGIGYGLYKILRQPSPAAAPSQMTKVTRLTANGRTKLAAVSPDGKFVAYVVDDEGQQSLWLQNIAGRSDVQILPSEEKVILGSVTFSPDGNYLYYGAKGTLNQLPILGGAPKKVLQNFGGATQHNEITFSPDGKQFAFVRYSSEGEEIAAIIVANADGAGERILASTKRPNLFLNSAAWSPDGKVIACSAMSSDAITEIVTVRVADGVVSPIPSLRWNGIRQVVWRPDAGGLMVVGTEGDSFLSQIWQLSYPSGEARNLTNDSNDYQSVSLMADGRSVVTVRAEQEAHLWVMSSEETSQAKQLTKGFEKYDGIYAIDWLRSGKIIYEALPSGKSEVWMIDPDGGNAKQFAPDITLQTTSPDGNYLVFQDEQAGEVGLFRLNLSDGETKRLTTGIDDSATFSPDSKWVVFTRDADQVALWKVSIEGGEAVKLTNIPGYPVTPTVSPDGKLIAFRWGASGARKLPAIGIVPFEGGEIVKAFNASIGSSQGYGKTALQWTPDGQAVSYVSSQNGASNIWRQPIDGSRPIQVTNFRDGRIFNFAYSQDGKRLALSRGTFNRDVVLISNPG